MNQIERNALYRNDFPDLAPEPDPADNPAIDVLRLVGTGVVVIGTGKVGNHDRIVQENSALAGQQRQPRRSGAAG